MEKVIRIIIADVNDLQRSSLAALLNTFSDFNVIAEVSDKKELFRALRNQHADILLLDANLAGLSIHEIITELRKNFPFLKTVMRGNLKGASLIQQLFLDGLNCFLPENCNKAQLYESIRKVYKTGRSIDEKLSWKLIDNNEAPGSFKKLTKTELVIFKMICRGLSSKYMAAELGRSRSTIAYHRANIRQKLNVHSVPEQIQYAVENHISTE
jgi:two-component system, NarL family, response regulator NreC